MDCNSLWIIIPTSVLALLIVGYFIKKLLPKPQVGDFDNKFVLITGCDSGFGNMAAIRLDKMGFRVIATCLTQEGVQNLQATCSDRLVAMIMDVTNSRQIHDVFTKVKTLVADRGVWAVANNAGYFTIGPITWYKMDDFRKMADVNLWGLIEVTNTFLPLVKKAKGRIINVSSVAGINTVPYMGPYCITKYGVEAFCDALRREIRRFDVKVVMLEPQAFETPLLNEMYGKKLDNLWNGAPDELKNEDGEKELKFLREVFRENFSGVTSPKVHMVVDTIIEAVVTRDPKARYLVGPLSTFYAFLSHLPTSVQDWMMPAYNGR